MDKTNNKAEENWLFDKMTTDELRVYLKAQTSLLKATEDVVKTLDDQCAIMSEIDSVMSKLVNNRFKSLELERKHTKALTELMQIDSEMNSKYMDEYLSEDDDAI